MTRADITAAASKLATSFVPKHEFSVHNLVSSRAVVPLTYMASGSSRSTLARTRFLDAKYAQSVKPTIACLPVESSANSTPFAPANEQSELPDTVHPDQQQGPKFDPRGWAVHLKMLTTRGTLVRVALAEVKKELRAPTRSLRAKATRPTKKATAVVAGACA